MMIPQGATMICSLCMRLRPSWARIRSFLPLGSAPPTSKSSNSLAILAMSWFVVIVSSATESFGWATSARWRRSLSRNLDCPLSRWICSTFWCAASEHMRLLATVRELQPTTAQIVLWWASLGQKRCRLFSSGFLQLWIPQHGQPMVTPSMTTTQTFFPSS